MEEKKLITAQDVMALAFGNLKQSRFGPSQEEIDALKSLLGFKEPESDVVKPA